MKPFRWVFSKIPVPCSPFPAPCVFPLGLGLLAGCLGLKDFSNRVYHPYEPIPLRPFVMQATQSELEIQGDQVMLKTWVYVFNPSPDQNKLFINRFSLRLGPKEGALQPVGETQTVIFDPGRSHAIPLKFILSKDDQNQELGLILDRAGKKGKESLTLVKITPPHFNLSQK